MNNIIPFPTPRSKTAGPGLLEPGACPGLEPGDEYDPNDPGVDMSEYLAEFNAHYPDYDRWMPNADALPF